MATLMAPPEVNTRALSPLSSRLARLYREASTRSRNAGQVS